MRLVIKFGGVPVKDGKSILNAARLAVDRHRRGDKVVVVTSAMAGITDELIEISHKLIEPRANPKQLISEFMDHISNKHFQACRVAIDDKDVLHQTTRAVKDALDGLERALTGIAHLGELSLRSQDLIMSFGERLSAPILAGAIKALGVPSCHLTGFEAGIITDERYTEARPKLERTRKLVRQRLSRLLAQGKLPVVTGFVAGTENGTVTTLGRGGSDYSASIIGAALKVDEIWIMTDVDGIMTADPKAEPSAKVIETISYLEATELAYFGAKVLHPKTIEPAMELGIPVRVRNAFNPSHAGTLIVKEPREIEGIVKAITASKEVAIITVGGPGMIGTLGVAATVFEILANANVKVLMISQSSSQANISFIVGRGDLETALRALHTEFAARHIDWRIDYDRSASVIATVGAGMKGTPGVAARVFGTMGREGINILMIAQGSSELNISFAVDERDAVRAVRALHAEFGLGASR
ncbi:MAG: aspartate kinase [Candidatus Hodarchaeaceae archaeon]|nr:aspartate kinase [Candidatus Hodarchaeaceae archaeon]